MKEDMLQQCKPYPFRFCREKMYSKEDAPEHGAISFIRHKAPLPSPRQGREKGGKDKMTSEILITVLPTNYGIKIVNGLTFKFICNMKTIKIKRRGLSVLLSLIIGSTLIVGAGNKNSVKQNNIQPIWFDYTSTSTNPLDFENPNNYQPSADPQQGQNCPEGNDIRCKIKALPSSSNPNVPDMTTVIEVHDRAL